jgi:DNA-binding CsgD family transcriptional regulator
MPARIAAAPGALHGRDAERSALDALLSDAREGRSGALVVRGAPGLGKTALLDDAACRADGLRLLRATGAEAESGLPFAGLNQLLHPVLELADALPAPQAAALRRALGIAGGPAPEPLLLGAAVLAILAEAAPVAAFVDDGQWLDGPSLAALAFAGRRLRAEGIALALAVRDEAPALGLPERLLGPLDEAAARAVLRRCDLAPSTRTALIEAAAGNPLALVELPAALSADQLAGRAPLEPPLPVPARLEAVYAARLDTLSPAGRERLLLAAADGTGDPRPLLGPGGRDGAETLEAIEAAGLVSLRRGRVAWRHPLARSAVLRAATPAELRAAHAALAGVADPDRAAWHRAEAAVGPDDDAAAALSAAAERARGRAAHAVVATALARAAELSSDRSAATAWRLAAARSAWRAGHADRALALLDAAGPPAEPLAHAATARIRGGVELHRGSPARAHRLLSEAATALLPHEPAAALRLGVASMEAASLAGLAPELPVPDDTAGGGGDEERFLRAFVTGVRARFAGDVAGAAESLTWVVHEGAGLLDPQLVVWAGAAAFFIGDEDAAVALHERAVTLARAAGDASVLPFALTFLATAHLWSGRPAVAEAEGDEARRLAQEAGQDNLVVQVDALLAGVAALRGEEERCRELADGARARARERGLVLAEGTATIALGELELALGAPDAAFDRLDRLAHAEGAHPAHRFAVVPTLVEAAARAGRAPEARAPAEEFAAWAQAIGSGWALPLASRCLALLAEDDAVAEAHLTEALRLHDRHRRPLDLARTELVIGERLRRARRKAEARAPLRSALEAFESAGATPWAERAREELRAAGESPPRRGGRPLDRLTPQELQVARLVARGASNRDTAAALFLSPRTVEYHLQKVFRKLGVHARAELAAALAPRADPVNYR